MKAVLPNNDLTLWHLSFMGAKGTLYESESFTLQLRFSNDYVPSSTFSPSNLPKLSSSDTYQSTSISTLTASYVCPFFMTVTNL